MQPVGPSRPSDIRDLQPQRRLKPEQVKELQEDYVVGVTVNTLARKYDINRKTVMEHARRGGLKRSRQALLPKDVKLAAKLRAEGVPLADVAKQFGCHTSTVWRALNDTTRS